MPTSTGRVVLVTGASGGLGQSVTGTFLKAGSTVAGVARSWAGKSFDGTFVPIEADLSTAQGAAGAVERAITAAGAVHAVVHLMGGFAGGQPVHQTDDETWDRMLSLNLSSAFRVFRAALPHLLSTGGGRIVAVGSRAGVEPSANLSAYNVSKAGLHALVKTLAAETRDSGITVNAVLPSIIDTRVNRAVMPSADFSRWVTPQSIAELLLWLTSDAAANVSGALIPVYGRA